LQIGKALDQAEATKGKPTFVVAHTVKGKGVSFMENLPCRSLSNGNAAQTDGPSRGERLAAG
jgi:transketolase